MNKSDLKILFFGTPEFAETTLEILKSRGFLPTLIVTGEDKPFGRKLILTPPPVKTWAVKNNIPFIQPKTLKSEEIVREIKSFGDFDISIVASYGKIIPKSILDIPKKGNLNIHPSLLPRLRGPSPIQSAILTENSTGVSIILLDEEMDHGPILIQEKTEINWPPYADILEEKMAIQGANLLSKIIIDYVDGKIIPKEQDHSMATFCKKIKKEDGYIDLNESPEKNLRKIRGYRGSINTYCFFEQNNNKIRLIIREAEIIDGKLEITKVIPEGKKEMSFDDFKRGFR